MKYDQKQITIVAGMGQSGKTTFALRYLLNAELSCRFIFDPEEEYAARLGIPAAADAYDLGLALARGWVLFDPNTLFPGRHKEALAWFCQWTYDLCPAIAGRKAIVIDEVWKYCDPWQIPLPLAQIVLTGRKRGLGLMVNVQMPQKLNGALLAEVTETVCFQLQHAKALELMASRGFDPEQLLNLPPFRFVACALAGGQLAGTIRV